MSSMRTIRVTGKGQIRLRPDTTRIAISLEGIYPEYSEMLQHSAQDTECLRDILAGFGFERSELKTLNFKVDTEYERYNEDGSYKQRFVGYKFQHRMKVEFASDNERLGKILYALAHCPINPKFKLSYTVKDQEAVKNELVGKAVTDAKKKAAVLTQAAGVELKDIQSIDYSWGQINLEARPMSGEMLTSEEIENLLAPLSASYDLDIEPDDIEVSDTVTVVWEIR